MHSDHHFQSDFAFSGGRVRGELCQEMLHRIPQICPECDGECVPHSASEGL